ncbi:RHS repeat-associated core domain-containing protein, partial [Apibacter raozihei]
ERNNSWNTPYLFNGKELDEETGLYYYGARYYNPRESVFLSVDPLTEMTGTPYQYCYQNPVKYIDPTGMKADWHEDGNGNLVADKGDSAGTLAKKLNMSQKAAEEMLEKQGYKTYERDGKRYTQINQGSKVKWYCKLSDAPKSKSKSSGNAQGASSTSNTTSGSNVSTTTKSIVTERELIPNPLISVTSNVTKTYGNAGMFNTDSKVTNGINASQDYQFNLLDLIKSNTEVSSSSISMGVGISVFGLNDVSAGVKLDSNVLNSEINVGISEDINRDNTSTGSSIGVKPLGILVILGIMKSGNLAPLLNPQTILSY